MIKILNFMLSFEDIPGFEIIIVDNDVIDSFFTFHTQI